jgi:hypothetical protein
LTAVGRLSVLIEPGGLKLGNAAVPVPATSAYFQVELACVTQGEHYGADWALIAASLQRPPGRRVESEGPMRNIVDEAGEIIAKASDDHTLLGGHTASRWRPALVANCSGKIAAKL